MILQSLRIFGSVFQVECVSIQKFEHKGRKKMLTGNSYCPAFFVTLGLWRWWIHKVKMHHIIESQTLPWTIELRKMHEKNAQKLDPKLGNLGNL